MEKTPFLVIVFPQDSSDAAAVRELVSRVLDSLRAACGAAPITLRPNLTTVCCLCIGELASISGAVRDVIDPYAQWLVVPVGKPFEASGLASFAQGLTRAN